MEINDVYFPQLANGSTCGLEQTSISKDVPETYGKCGVQLLNNNNMEKGNARKDLQQVEQQQEDRVLFRHVPNHVIDCSEQALEQHREYSSEISFQSDWFSGAPSLISSAKFFDGRASVSTSQTSSLSECSPSIDETCGTAPLAELTSTSGEAEAVTSDFESTSGNTLTDESSRVSASASSASGCASSVMENSVEQQELPVSCGESVLSYEAKPNEKKDESSVPEKPAQSCARGFFEEDKEFDFLKAASVRRSSSLKSTASSCSLSKKKKKEVRFADVLGLDLESVQHITSASEPPIVPQKALRDLELGEKSDDYCRAFKQVLQLCPSFSMPGCKSDFAQKVSDRKVMLETVSVDDDNLTVTGSICVSNLAYVKRIFVRYTTNGWLTHEDVNAGYLGGSNEGRLDKFLFTIKLPSSFGFGNRLEFAVSFESAGQTYWDNNGKSNYRVMCYFKQVS